MALEALTPRLIPTANLVEYGHAVLGKLARLLVVQNLDEPLRRRCVFAAYEDCIAVGLKAEADDILRTGLDMPAMRHYAPVRFGLIDDPQICNCGHHANMHHMATVGLSAGCMNKCNCRGFDNDRPPKSLMSVPPAEKAQTERDRHAASWPCTCSHSLAQHGEPEDGGCTQCNCDAFEAYVPNNNYDGMQG